MAYRAAVQACLQSFYGKTAAQAESLARDWWERLSRTSAFESGIFLHAEPINTAGRIAGKEIVEITGENEAAYDRLLKESTRTTRTRTPKRASARSSTTRSMEKSTTGVLSLPSPPTKSKSSLEKRLASAKA